MMEITLLKNPANRIALNCWCVLALTLFFAADIVHEPNLDSRSSNAKQRVREAIRFWKMSDGNGAFAASTDGHCGWRAELTTLDAARTGALSTCRKQSTSCKLIAEIIVKVPKPRPKPIEVLMMRAPTTIAELMKPRNQATNVLAKGSFAGDSLDVVAGDDLWSIRPPIRKPTQRRVLSSPCLHGPACSRTLRVWISNKLCRKATDPFVMKWDYRTEFAFYVTEARHRALSIADCRLALGLTEATGGPGAVVQLAWNFKVHQRRRRQSGILEVSLLPMLMKLRAGVCLSTTAWRY